ncbi:MAG TPA: glycoside hydrolase family 3 N-terminal domain-containing protein [Conexibacter sp.]|jgi:beta-N-acetylhexosaminidase|nr:glycoside hydrolase family 3 N-terminal domain-containing protein [Conexibacter sp.]
MLTSLLAVAVFAAVGGGAPGPSDGASGLTLAQAVGQRMVVSLPSTTVPDALARQVRRGEVAGVILFGRNIASRSQLRALTARLQTERKRGPASLRDRPLLVMIDQEGGLVKRLSGAPSSSAAGMGATGDVAAVRAEGVATARNLRGVGVNVDLAPVLDLGLPGSFQRATGRAFASTPTAVSRYGGAFADGLGSGGVLAAAKHFPGLGRATADEDQRLNRIEVDLDLLRAADEAPFAAAARAGVPLTMVSTGVYPALSSRPAMFSQAIATTELRRTVGFDGVSISDDMEVPALAHLSPERKALAAVRAGNDLLLFCQSAEAAERGAAALRRAVASGAITRATIDTGAERVLALRDRLR